MPRAPARKDEKPKTFVLEAGCKYGNVNVGEDTVRIGITCGRGNLTLTQADKLLCSKRLRVKLLAVDDGRHDQPNLPGTETGGDQWVEGYGDVMGFRVTGKSIGWGITFALASIDLETLTKFAKRDGAAYVIAVGDIPADAPKTTEPEE